MLAPGQTMECTTTSTGPALASSDAIKKPHYECLPTTQHANDRNKVKPNLSLSLQPLLQQTSRVKRRDTATSTDTAFSNDSEGSSLSLGPDSPISSPNTTSPELSPIGIAKPTLLSQVDTVACPWEESLELLASPTVQQEITVTTAGAGENESPMLDPAGGQQGTIHTAEVAAHEKGLEPELEHGPSSSHEREKATAVGVATSQASRCEEQKWKLGDVIRGWASWVSGEIAKVWCLPGSMWGGASVWLGGWGGNDVGNLVGEEELFWDVGVQIRSWEVEVPLSEVEGREAVVEKSHMGKQQGEERLEEMADVVFEHTLLSNQESKMMKEKSPSAMTTTTPEVGEQKSEKPEAVMDDDVVEGSLVRKQDGEVVKVKSPTLSMPPITLGEGDGGKKVLHQPIVIPQAIRPNPNPTRIAVASPPSQVQTPAAPSPAVQTTALSFPKIQTTGPSTRNHKKQPAEPESPEQTTKTGRRKRKKSQSTTIIASSAPSEPVPPSKKQPPSPQSQQQQQQYEHSDPVPTLSPTPSSTPKPQPNSQEVRKRQQTVRLNTSPSAKTTPVLPKKQRKNSNPALAPESSPTQSHKLTIQSPPPALPSPPKVQEQKGQTPPKGPSPSPSPSPSPPQPLQPSKEPPPEIPQFCGKVILDQHQKAYMYGRIASSLFSPSIDPSSHPAEFGPHHLVLWTDGSWTQDKTDDNNTAGIGIVYRQYGTSGQPPLPWQEHAYTLASPNPLCSTCETLAIETALSLALHQICPRNPQITQLTILSDAKTNLRVISNLHRKRPADPFAKGAALSESLQQRGVQTTLRWVPAHVGVEGNDRADRAARLARIFGDSVSFPPPITESGGAQAGGGGGGGIMKEVTMTKMPVPLLERFEELLETIRRLEGERDKVLTARLRRVEMLGVVESLGRVAREEGWVYGP